MRICSCVYTRLDANIIICNQSCKHSLEKGNVIKEEVQTKNAAFLTGSYGAVKTAEQQDLDYHWN